MKDTLTVSEVAELCSVSERTVWNWIRKNTIQAIKEEGKTRIEKDQIVSLMPKKETQEKIPEGYILIQREIWDDLQKQNKEMLRTATEMGFRIGQLETEKRQLQGLIEDKRTWWKKLFSLPVRGERREKWKTLS